MKGYLFWGWFFGGGRGEIKNKIISIDLIFLDFTLTLTFLSRLGLIVYITARTMESNQLVKLIRPIISKMFLNSLNCNWPWV